ncbi:uncharacterized protein VTP21DRAFT_6684 [Calcarisporiella thermophila]|uniref:uncharacterized protein n=1 Tax=Calcarisporiella thermophila TaxID=911321 RepID=UPI0037432148
MDESSQSPPSASNGTPASTTSSQLNSTNNVHQDELTSGGDSVQGKKKSGAPKRRKVTHACVYCRRSHMTCDDGRPCQRCIKRGIEHMCHDEPKTSQGAQNARAQAAATSIQGLRNQTTNVTSLPMQIFSPIPSALPTTPLTFASEHMGNEFSVISDFLEGLEENQSKIAKEGTPINTTEKFFLTAADPSDGTSEDRLREVINAKYEAGLLKPYNYVNGYARLQKYMEGHMGTISRQRILKAMSTFRPAFRAVAQSLTDLDLILVEEAFERLLLDYDRVFSSMGIPACLWRRTGEIYKGNKEFASLVNIPIEMLREGRLCIYELMAEESAVNYWEKYGNIAFDAGQKAVLTSCLLKSPDSDNTNVISCCFSFTIRRDKYNIPTAIVGNFLPVQLP